MTISKENLERVEKVLESYCTRWPDGTMTLMGSANICLRKTVMDLIYEIGQIFQEKDDFLKECEGVVEEISKMLGTYSRDHFEHAKNVIEYNQELAKSLLDKIRGEK